MKETEFEEIVRCDVCNSKITFYCRDQIEIKGHAWDVCKPCMEKLECILQFLALVVGIDIPHPHPPTPNVCNQVTGDVFRLEWIDTNTVRLTKLVGKP